MNVTQGEAAALLRAWAAACGSGSRERCPSPEHLIAIMTSIAPGVDRLGIADHLQDCEDCWRELLALVVLFRGKRDVEIAPLSEESRPRRGLLGRAGAALRDGMGLGGRHARAERAQAASRSAIEKFKPAIGVAIEKLGGIQPPIDRDALESRCSEAATVRFAPSDSAEKALRAAVHAAYETAAAGVLEASRRSGAGKAHGQAPPEIAAQIAGAVRGLADRRRQVIILYLVGMRIPEIAISLAYSDDQARNLLLRGLKELAERLTPSGILLD